MGYFDYLGDYLFLVSLIVILFFLGIKLTFQNKVSTDWFESFVHKNGLDRHGITTHKFNRVMFMIEGVICLLMAVFVLILFILSVMGIVDINLG